jgi:uncharacterized protein (TIGR02265 family)
MPEALVTDQTIDNLLRPYRNRLLPNVVRRLSALGVDANGKLLPTFLRPVQDETIRVLAEEYYPGQPMDVSTRQVGADSIRVVEESLMGRTLMRMLRLLPHQAALKRLPTLMRIGNNFLDVKVTDLGGKRYTLDLNEAGAWPQYWIGLMSTANTVLLGFSRATVELDSYDGHRAVITCDLEPNAAPLSPR